MWCNTSCVAKVVERLSHHRMRTGTLPGNNGSSLALPCHRNHSSVGYRRQGAQSWSANSAQWLESGQRGSQSAQCPIKCSVKYLSYHAASLTEQCFLGKLPPPPTLSDLLSCTSRAVLGSQNCLWGCARLVLWSCGQFVPWDTDHRTVEYRNRPFPKESDSDSARVAELHLWGLS